MRTVLVVVTSWLVCAVAACGERANPSVRIGGTVTGLQGAGLVLGSSAGDELAIADNGSFALPMAVAFGHDYAVTVAAQPSSPSQTCTVMNGSGTVTSPDDVTDIVVPCVTERSSVGGTVSGLAGIGLVLQNNGTDDLAVTANGTFTFPTPLSSGTAFAVTVATQPSGPTQTCTVSGGSGTIGGGPVTTVVVDCAADRFTVGGIIAGLSGTVLLQNNGADDITLSSNGSFAFPTTVASGDAYAVTVRTHPDAPSQTCVVSSGGGTVTDADITSVRVDCTTNTFTIGGTVIGLAGTGLVLQNNGGDDLPIPSDGSFTFPTPVVSGQPYVITVLSRPSGPLQDCTLTGDAGTVGGTDIADVTVTCTTRTFPVGGTVTGLAGTGLVLQNNGGDDLPISADGTFTFSMPVANGETFAVTVASQPSGPTQTCTVAGGTGTVGAGAVTSVVVNCSTNTYTVGGTIAGLAGTVVLRNNGGDDLTLTANGSFAFATPIESGDIYAVTVLTHPTIPSQTCTVSAGTGTVTNGDVTNLSVTCRTHRFTVGGLVSGIAGSGLVLRNDTGDDLPVTGNGSFTFSAAVASGAAYAVTVAAQPTDPSQTCVVTSASGVIGSAAVVDVVVTCTTNTYRVGGTVTGLVGGGLVLRNHGGDDLHVAANGTFQFSSHVTSGGSYAVSVFAQPSAPWQTCVVTSGTGTVTNADVTSVGIACTTDTYTIGGTVTGLAGADLVLRNNGGDDLAIGVNGSFAFATAVASGDTFEVTVQSQPSGPAQTCTVGGGTGTVGGSDVTSITVSCATNRYTIAGTISGLADTVVLRNNGDDDLLVTANGTFGFPATVASGEPYDITVLVQPIAPSQACVVTGGSAIVASSDITDVQVTCTTDRFRIGGALTGLAPGSTVVLRNNGADDQTLTTNGPFTFPVTVPSGQPYAVTVLAHPAAPIAQTCVVVNGSGAIDDADVTNVAVSCTTNTYTLGGTVTGLLPGTSVLLRNHGGDDLAVSGDGAFTFPAPVASGATYAVTVGVQPVGLWCSVASANGTVGNADVSDVVVSCFVARSCAALLQAHPTLPSGTYMIDPDGSGALPAISAYCDMTTNGGGWTNLDFVNHRVLLANGGAVHCTMGLTATATSITCDLPYFDAAPTRPLYIGICDGSDRSSDYIIDRMGPLLGHQSSLDLGFDFQTQGFGKFGFQVVSTDNNEYCYAAGEVVRWDDPRCAQYNYLGNGNCIPHFFTLSRYPPGPIQP